MQLIAAHPTDAVGFFECGQHPIAHIEAEVRGRAGKHG
jgi:hypothetical protein